jgi:NADPH:quinone reductase-like Zn-dependent oxidoreductase
MTSSPATMRAVRLSAPGPVDNLRLTTLPLPPERDGWVRIRVEAFGLNRSELKLRLGLGVGVSFPRVPGIEAAGTVDAAPASSGLAPGQKVVAMIALDLVGTPTLPDTLRAVRVHGTACFGGSLSNQWTVRDFSPNEYLPKGVRLAGFSGDAADLPREAFQEILDAVAAGRLAFAVDRVYDGLEQVPQAHDDMEHDRATGKLVVRVRH